MNQPPPLQPDIEYRPPQPSRGLSTGAKWGIGCSIGCLITLLIGGLLAYLAFVKVKEAAVSLLDKFSSTSPVVFSAPPADQATIDSVLKRFDDFTEAMKEGRDVAPLALSGEEINLLINYHPEWKELAGHTSVSIDEDKLRCQVSVPLDSLNPFLKGRYFNGDATIRLGLADGKLETYVDDLRVGGKPLPPEVMTELKSANLFQDQHRNPELEELTRSIEAIRIENGRLIIVPQPASERQKSSAPADPAPAPAVEA